VKGSLDIKKKGDRYVHAYQSPNGQSNHRIVSAVLENAIKRHSESLITTPKPLTQVLIRDYPIFRPSTTNIHV